MIFFYYWLYTYSIILMKNCKTRYWLHKYTFASLKIGKTHSFFHNWLCKYMFDLQKIWKIHTFFTVNFFKCATFVLIGCINTHLFCSSIFFFLFFLTDFLKYVIFCNCFWKYAIILPKTSKFYNFLVTGCWKIELFRGWFFLNAWFVM